MMEHGNLYRSLIDGEYVSGEVSTSVYQFGVVITMTGSYESYVDICSTIDTNVKWSLARLKEEYSDYTTEYDTIIQRNAKVVNVTFTAANEKVVEIIITLNYDE